MVFTLDFFRISLHLYYNPDDGFGLGSGLNLKGDSAGVVITAPQKIVHLGVPGCFSGI